MISIEVLGGNGWLMGLTIAGAAICALCIALLVRWGVGLAIGMWTRRRGARAAADMWHRMRWSTLLWCLWLATLVGTATVATDAADKLAATTLAVLYVAACFTVANLATALSALYDEALPNDNLRSVDLLLIRPVHWLSFPIAAFIATILSLGAFGIRVVVVEEWLTAHGIRVLLIVAIGLTILRLASVLIPPAVRSAIASKRDNDSEEELRKQVVTFSSVALTAVEFAVVVVITITLLSEFGIDIGPSLAGFGVVGVAVGLGAQSLAKDFIGGVFILLDQQYRKGDIVRIGGVSGLVEDINLRRTILRDLSGQVHTVPHSLVGVATNLTRGWSGVELQVSVPYNTNIGEAIALVNGACASLRGESTWADLLTDDPAVLRVDSIASEAIVLRVVGHTTANRQWEVAGELRLRIKAAFDKAEVTLLGVT